MSMRISSRALLVLCSLCPLVVVAQTEAVSRIVGVFNVFVGLMLAVALIVYFGGFAMWWVRLGTWPSYRTEAIKVMEWAVVILFVLVVLLGIVQFFQNHQGAAAYVISVLVAVGIMWIILYLMRHTGEKEKKSDKGGKE